MPDGGRGDVIVFLRYNCAKRFCVKRYFQYKGMPGNIWVCHEDKFMSRCTLEFNMKRYINFKVLLTWVARCQNQLSPTRWICRHFPPGLSRLQYKVGLSSHEDKFASECFLNKIQHENINLKVSLTDMGIWCQSTISPMRATCGESMRVLKNHRLIIIWR